MKSKKTRRNFIKSGTAALCVLAAAGGSARAAAPGAEEKKPDQSWDDMFEVIIIGSGLAGLVAGLSAQDNGVHKVVILEKMGMEGGSTAISNGTISVPGSPLQQQQGIQDSPEALLKDILKAGNGYCHKELTITLAEKAHSAYSFIVKHGAKFKKTVMQPSGMTAKRLLQPDYNAYTGLLQPLRASFVSRGGEVRTCCRVDSLVQNAQGAVIGVMARTDYHFDTRLSSDDIKNTTGTPVTYAATKGVVCCTGGFEADKTFRAQELPQFADAFTTEQPGATASGFRLLALAGARMIHGPLYRPAFPCTDEQPFGMMIDPSTGKRFVREDAGRIPVFHAASDVLSRNGGRIPLSILDQDACEMVENKHRLKMNTDAGYVSQYESLEALAKHFDISEKVLLETVSAYNIMVETGKDTELGADFSKTKSNKIDKAPFYAVMIKPNLTYSLAGALITPRAEVLSIATETPVPGLYAAGEATAGVHGGMRLGGCAILDCCVFGMIAGQEVAGRSAERQDSSAA